MRPQLLRIRPRVLVSPAFAGAARESPTPIALFPGLARGSLARAGGGALSGARGAPPIVERLTRAGFNVARVRFEAVGAGAGAGGAATVDELVEALHAALQAALAAPPAAVAPHASAVLLQKYLESWPLAGLLALDPLPPDLARRPDARRARWLAAAGGDAEAAEDGGGAPAAALLDLLAADGPVRLEPQPVPVCALFSEPGAEWPAGLAGDADGGGGSGGGALLLDEERLATSDLHELGEDDVAEGAEAARARAEQFLFDTF